MKSIAIGSSNPTKINAVKTGFQAYDVIFKSISIPSGVSEQPFTDEETRIGAINRATNAMREGLADCGIGLEGGVYETKEGIYLCNWGALYTKEEQLYTAAGARILLPQEVAEGLRTGMELADVMEQYSKKKDVRSKEGAIGIFTNDRVLRRDMFTHIIHLLVGQYEYGHKRE